MFAAAYVANGYNATLAYQKAYPRSQTNSAKANGHILLRDAKVAAEVKRLSEAQLGKFEISHERTIRETALIAYANHGDAYDSESNLRPMATLPADVTRTIAGSEVVKKNLVAGDGMNDTVMKIKHWDKVRALDLLSKIQGLQKDKLEVSGDAELIALLQARDRAEKATKL